MAPGRTHPDSTTDRSSRCTHSTYSCRRNALAHRDREVAVGAAADAEGDVDVEVAHGGNVTGAEEWWVGSTTGIPRDPGVRLGARVLTPRHRRGVSLTPSRDAIWVRGNCRRDVDPRRGRRGLGTVIPRSSRDTTVRAAHRVPCNIDAPADSDLASRKKDASATAGGKLTSTWTWSVRTACACTRTPVRLAGVQNAVSDERHVALRIWATRRHVCHVTCA